MNRRDFLKSAIVLFTSLVVSRLPQLPVFKPRIKRIGKHGEAYHCNLNEAVEQAQSGDTLILEAGEYTHQGTIHIKSGVSLCGRGPYET